MKRYGVGTESFLFRTNVDGFTETWQCTVKHMFTNTQGTLMGRVQVTEGARDGEEFTVPMRPEYVAPREQTYETPIPQALQKLISEEGLISVQKWPDVWEWSMEV